MTRKPIAARRPLLAALSGLALGAPALAGAATPAAADAALIRLCGRYLELEAALSSPTDAYRHLDCDERPEWAEYCAVEDAMLATPPRTLAGMTALARVALLCDASVNAGGWDDHHGARVARALLLLLAGPDTAREVERLAGSRDRAVDPEPVS